MAHYGKFSGVRNYITLVGTKSPDLEETCGCYGEKLVLLAQSLGLNTCWVAMTHGKSAAKILTGEKQTCLIALGYGKTQGAAHKSKTGKKRQLLIKFRNARHNHRNSDWNIMTPYGSA